MAKLNSIKQQLYQHCMEVLNNRLKTIQNTISDIQKSLESETKSTAGDKHETGRAMLQLEREKAGQQLAEVQKLQDVLQKIDISSKQSKVALGSLVKTSELNYFLAISIGEVKIDDQSYYCISPSTPIGQLLLSRGEGEQINFRNRTFVISEIE